ncbi:hypothetical protein CT0861_13257 [Colletotrichum tofieldiae]|uniref:Uncharacterized protein n=1 Tax=Colletotrichum tofieldiae TaxID=708197 RepID=A0A161VXW0_9PEZI|nr:hypothetical protein CT0861_13257 [Colletotrichum tofieldiae]
MVALSHIVAAKEAAMDSLLTHSPRTMEATRTDISFRFNDYKQRVPGLTFALLSSPSSSAPATDPSVVFLDASIIRRNREDSLRGLNHG